MKKLDIVITMGGAGSRFQAAGYTVPKYMIEAKGRTLFEWSMMSLEGYRKEADRYIFIVLDHEKEDVGAFVAHQCKKLGLKHYSIILLEELTEGQAATALLAARYWKEDHGLLIYNIDTYVEAGEMNSAQLKGDGFLPCFQAEGEHWSFVRTDESGQAVEIKEKCRISDHCTLGAYYFKTCGLYQSLYREYYREDRHLVNGEKYVAPLYNCLVSNGGKVYITDIAPWKVHVLGTPEELEKFVSAFPKEAEKK